MKRAEKRRRLSLEPKWHLRALLGRVVSLGYFFTANLNRFEGFNILKKCMKQSSSHVRVVVHVSCEYGDQVKLHFSLPFVEKIR